MKSFSGPIEDGRLVSAAPGKALQALPGALPILIGTTSADLGLIPAASKEAAFALFGQNADRARTLYDPDGTLPLQQLTMQIGADRMMAGPAREIARLTEAKGAPAWRFRFGYVASGSREKPIRGAEHASDVAYAFGTLDAALDGKMTPLDASVADRLQRYWVNFARTGNPSEPGQAPWPQAPSILLIDPDGKMAAGDDPWQERLDMAEALPDAPGP